MAKQPSRRSEFKLTYIQLIVLAGFCLGCMAASYWLGFYTGTRAGYETAVTSDLASSSKIPINAAVPKEERAPSASDVYAKLDGTSPMSPVAAAPAAKNTGAAEIAAIPKMEVSPKPKESDIDAELAEKLLSPENKEMPQKAADTKSPAEGVWSSHPGSAPAGNEFTEKTLGGTKKEQMPEAAQPAVEKVHPTATPVPVRTVEKAALQEMVKQTPTPAPDREKEKAKEKEKLLKEKEAEKTAAAEAVPTPAMGAKIAKGWYAQVAAPKELKDAEAIAGKLKKSGFPVVVEHAKVRGEDYYRILVGPESGQETASRLVNQLKRESYLEGEPFIRMAK